MEEGVPIESKLITRRIEAAQKAVEGQNFESRKHVLEYDDVMNKQREAVYGTRRQLLEGIDQKELITDDYVSNILSTILDTHAPDKLHPDQWDIKALQDAVLMQFGMDITAEDIPVRELNRHELGEALFTHLKERYDAKEQIIGAPGHALSRAHDHAERAGWPVERPLAGDGPVEGRHRTARLWPAGPADFLQARILRGV